MGMHDATVAMRVTMLQLVRVSSPDRVNRDTQLERQPSA